MAPIWLDFHALSVSCMHIIKSFPFPLHTEASIREGEEGWPDETGGAGEVLREPNGLFPCPLEKGCRFAERMDCGELYRALHTLGKFLILITCPREQS